VHATRSPNVMARIPTGSFGWQRSDLRPINAL
jgi:hypothetical protein